ncbi:hypothetical protein D9615_010659 [Tricholomella constricta]|uniref:Anaphase-promoting complex subunit 2 TPR repeats domain-containing protein n=1 Tax=Tricholomella constricta TaxID=117010 RepID=A0A8H5GKP9_9AGAR|nr:hypothetical protein D9615_010659 [Tricholomella constricta]
MRTSYNIQPAEKAKAMVQGVGSRFDFHMNKTLCDLKTKAIFDIIIDFPDSVALQDLQVLQSLRKALQEQYWKEFTIFKPDKKRWLPHLGTIHLELQLEDRTIEADVLPLEAAFIKLFSSKSSQSPFSDFKASLRMHFSHLDSRRAYSRRGVGQPDCRAKRIHDLGGPGGEDDTEDTFRLLEIAEEPCSLGLGCAHKGADSEKRHHLSSILLHLLSARHAIFLPPLPLKNPVRASYGPVDAPTTAPPTQACPLVRLERSLGICEGEGDACRHAMADEQPQVNGVHEEDDEVGVRGEGGGVGVHVPEGGEAPLKGGWERSAAQAGWVKEEAAERVCLDFGAGEAGGEDCEAGGAVVLDDVSPG